MKTSIIRLNKSKTQNIALLEGGGDSKLLRENGYRCAKLNGRYEPKEGWKTTAEGREWVLTPKS